MASISVNDYKKTDKGTFYHKQTPDEVINILDTYLHRGQRLKLYYGDNKTGRDWNEAHDTTGTIGLSTGQIKVPLLLANVRSSGGGAILDHCVIKIKDVKTGHVLYQHEKYQAPKIEIVESKEPGFLYSLIINGQLYSNHKTERGAKILKSKLL